MPLLIGLVQFAGQMLFNAVVVLAAAIGLYEFYRMTLPAGRNLQRSIGLSFGTLFVICVCWHRYQEALLVLCAGFLLLAIVFLLRFGDISRVTQHLGVTVLGLIYVPFLLGHLAMLHSLESGRLWVFLALVVAMAGDSSAYFVGSTYGRRKLYPAISPNKSIEGALGGVAGSVLGAVVFGMIFMPRIDTGFIFLLSLILAVAGQLGDLFESMLKRNAGVKDSGQIIPGHGGILDRLDSLLFVFPVAYYWIVFFG